jgi:hypothetical protein
MLNTLPLLPLLNAWKSLGEKASFGGIFTEQDIEFMKKAIQNFKIKTHMAI